MFSTQACMQININMSCFIYKQVDDFNCPTNMIIQFNFSELNVLNIELCVCFGLSFCSSFFDMHMLF
jgi:hypothetical protein